MASALDVHVLASAATGSPLRNDLFTLVPPLRPRLLDGVFFHLSLPFRIRRLLREFDPDAVLVGRETILRDGEAVGYLTSGGYGYTVGRSIGYGYVRREEGVTDEHLAGGRYELVVANEALPARWLSEAPYDPNGDRVRS